MTVRREGESVDYRVGFWSLSQYTLEIDILRVFQLLIFGWFGSVHSREAVVWFYSGYAISVSDFNIRIGRRLS